MPLLLVVALEPAHGLLHQGLVVARLAEEGEEPLAAQGLLVGAEDLERDPGADLDGIGELDGVVRDVALLGRGIDAGRAVALADQPALQPVGVLARLAAAEAVAGLEPELLDQGRGRERRHRVIEGDGADDGAGAAVYLVGDHGPPAHRVGGDRDPDARLEIAVGRVQVPEGEDAPHHPLLGERLGRALGHRPPQVVAVEAELAHDADLLHLHHGAEHDDRHHAAAGRVVAGVELELRGVAGRLEVAQGVADGQVGERLADLDLDQVLEVERLVERRVAAHFDGGDEGTRRAGGISRTRRIGPIDPISGTGRSDDLRRRRLGRLARGRAGRQQRQRQGRGCPPRGEPPQKRRSHCASTV